MGKRETDAVLVKGGFILENDIASIESIQNVHAPLIPTCKPLRVYPQVRDTDGEERIQAETSLAGCCVEGR